MVRDVILAAAATLVFLFGQGTATAETVFTHPEFADVATAAATLERECPVRRSEMFSESLGGVAVLRQSSPPATSGELGLRVYLDQLEKEFRLAARAGVALPEARNAAISGLVKGLGDPESSWINPEEYEAPVRPKPGYAVGLVLGGGGEEPLVIVEVLPESPAEKAGLRSEDELVEIDGAALTGVSKEDAIRKLKDDQETSVRVGVRRRGGAETLHFDLTRAIISTTPMVVSREGKVSIIRLRSFNERQNGALTENVKAAVEAAIKGGAAGLVLDLRNNSGGAIDEVAGVVDLFLDGGVIGAYGPVGPCPGAELFTLRARRGDVSGGVPMVVLVNRGTGSGAEMAAAALQHNGRAKIVGAATEGRGVLQTVIPVRNRLALRLHTGQLILANGAPLMGRGVRPDVEVVASHEGSDAALGRALVLLSAR